MMIVAVFSSTVIHMSASAQSRKMIRIDSAKELIMKDDVRRLLEDVRLSHENIIMYCDSAWSYQSTNTVDAFGHVHIVSNDTLHLYSDFVHYDGSTGLARSFGSVKLTNPSITLTTDTLDYDMHADIGYYECWGTVVDSSNTLVSRIGRYYSKEDVMFFKDSVELVNEQYSLWSDTLKYNTKTEIAYIVGPTRIESDTTNIYSELGWFDTKNQNSELLKNSTIRRGDSQLQADTIYYDDSNASGYAYSNVIINDYSNQIIVAGNFGSYKDFNQNAIITDSALFIQYDKGDSLFLHSDTIFVTPDTIEDQKIIRCFYGARFYRNDMQGLCDSMVYITNDSIIKLFTDPVLWSDNSQMTSDYIEIRNNSTPPNTIDMRKNAFIIQKIDDSKYNQIKGKDMVGLINERDLYQVDVDGNGQTIFYPEDAGGVIGANRAESSKLRINLSDNRVKRVTYLSSPVGVMKPITEISEADSKLEGFNWRESERPIDKLDIYRKGSEKREAKEISLPSNAIDKKLDVPQKNRVRSESETNFGSDKTESSTDSTNITDEKDVELPLPDSSED